MGDGVLDWGGGVLRFMIHEKKKMYGYDRYSLYITPIDSFFSFDRYDGLCGSIVIYFFFKTRRCESVILPSLKVGGGCLMLWEEILSKKNPD
jgi:hypothetical protein